VAPAEALQFKEGIGETPVAALAGEIKTGAAGALVGAMEFTKAFNKVKALTVPMPVAKSHPEVAA
jgi:hypothetical protein